LAHYFGEGGGGGGGGGGIVSTGTPAKTTTTELDASTVTTDDPDVAKSPTRGGDDPLLWTTSVIRHRSSACSTFATSTMMVPQLLYQLSQFSMDLDVVVKRQRLEESNNTMYTRHFQK
jgi:hypothetical protein